MAQLEELLPDPHLLPPAPGVLIAFESGSAIVTLSGEIDLAMQSGLEFVAEEATIRALPVRVNLSDVTFMDAAGVAMLAALVRTGSDSGWRLEVIGPSQLILDTLTVVGLLPAVDVHQTEIQAQT